MEKQKLKQIIQDPMGSDDIIHYFPNAKITTYADLHKYKSIKQLLPAQEDFVFILYEDSPRTGHWVCLTRDIHNSINYFDSYGGKVDDPLTWSTPAERKQLKMCVPYLSKLLDKTPEPVFWNDEDYQRDGFNINTCGRHCCYYILNMLYHDMSLLDYHKHITALKKKHKMTYDEVVAKYIRKM